MLSSVVKGKRMEGGGGGSERNERPTHRHIVCLLLCFVNPILGNRYGPGVSSCHQTSDNNLGWPDPHPSP